MISTWIWLGRCVLHFGCVLVRNMTTSSNQPYMIPLVVTSLDRNLHCIAVPVFVRIFLQVVPQDRCTSHFVTWNWWVPTVRMNDSMFILTSSFLLENFPTIGRAALRSRREMQFCFKLAGVILIRVLSPALRRDCGTSLSSNSKSSVPSMLQLFPPSYQAFAFDRWSIFLILDVFSQVCFHLFSAPLYVMIWQVLWT